MTRREAIAALAGLVLTKLLEKVPEPSPGPKWSTWTEAAEFMARFELRAIRDHQRLKRAGVPWLEPYESSGVISWQPGVSLVYAGSNCQADVSDLMRLAVDHFRQVGVVVLGAGLTPCKSVGCVFVWQSKAEALRTIEKWVS